MKEQNDPVKAQRPHTVTLDERSRAVIAGVEDVDSFNEQMIVLNTASGAMTLVGDQLHVSKLNLEDGQLIIEGHIVALEYDDRARPAKRAGLTRLFK
ncbi:MAG: YabP/YqfC family sporulation protein [Clostridia bacterium]